MNKLLLTLSILAVAFALHPRSISADMMNLPIQKAKCHRNANPCDLNICRIVAIVQQFPCAGRSWPYLHTCQGKCENPSGKSLDRQGFSGKF
jgi:hypothetical protein